MQKGNQDEAAQQFCSCSNLRISTLADGMGERVLRSIMHGLGICAGQA